MDVKVIFLGIGRVNDLTQLSILSTIGMDENKYQQIFQNVLQQNAKFASPDENIVSKDSEGNSWVYKIDKENLLYATYVRGDYPSRVASQIIDEIKEKFMSFVGIQRLQNEKQIKEGKKLLQEINEKYKDPSKVDKISQLQSQLQETQKVAQQNIQILVQGMENAQQLQEKTHEMAQSSASFKKSSTTLASIMRKRKCKLTCILVLVVIAVLLYIIIPIIIKAAN